MASGGSSGGNKPVKEGKTNASNALERTRDNKEGKHEGRGGNPVKIGQVTVELSHKQAYGEKAVQHAEGGCWRTTMAEESGGNKPVKEGKTNASNALGRTRGNKEGKHDGRGGNPVKIGQETAELTKSVEQARHRDRHRQRHRHRHRWKQRHRRQASIRR